VGKEKRKRKGKKLHLSKPTHAIAALSFGNSWEDLICERDMKLTLKRFWAN